MRFGGAVSVALLSSVIATLPAAVRITPSLGSCCGRPSGWLALVAVAFVPHVITTVTVRHAIAAIRLFDPRAVVTGVFADRGIARTPPLEILRRET